jgi:hypothetical protein
MPTILPCSIRPSAGNGKPVCSEESTTTTLVGGWPSEFGVGVGSGATESTWARKAASNAAWFSIVSSVACGVTTAQSSFGESRPNPQVGSLAIAGGPEPYQVNTQ